MGRMHSNGKGISRSAIPYKRTAPAWLKSTSEDEVRPRGLSDDSARRCAPGRADSGERRAWLPGENARDHFAGCWGHWGGAGTGLGRGRPRFAAWAASPRTSRAPKRVWWILGGCTAARGGCRPLPRTRGRGSPAGPHSPSWDRHAPGALAPRMICSVRPPGDACAFLGPHARCSGGCPSAGPALAAAGSRVLPSCPPPLPQVVELICRLAKKGMTPSQIGVVLRDSHGIPLVKNVTGNKILRILRVIACACRAPLLGPKPRRPGSRRWHGWRACPKASPTPPAVLPSQGKGLAPEIPEDLYCMIKKAVSMRKASRGKHGERLHHPVSAARRARSELRRPILTAAPGAQPPRQGHQVPPHSGRVPHPPPGPLLQDVQEAAAHVEVRVCHRLGHGRMSSRPPALRPLLRRMPGPLKPKLSRASRRPMALANATA